MENVWLVEVTVGSLACYAGKRLHAIPTRPKIPSITMADTPHERFYKRVLTDLCRSGIPFLVAGTYAFRHYVGSNRTTKDIDILCRPRDVRRLLQFCFRAGYLTERTYRHWLAKVYDRRSYADIIFRSSSRKLEVTDEWFLRSIPARVLGCDVRLVPREEMIAQKLYVAARDSFHGHDIYKLMHASGSTLDWRRLFRLVDDDWQVLYAHLSFFHFTFPNDAHVVPAWLLDELERREWDRRRRRRPSAIRFRGDQLSLVDYASPRELKALHNHPLGKS